MKLQYALIGIVLAFLIVIPSYANAWSNGGYTPSPIADDYSNVEIGTHDYIATMAWLMADNPDLAWIKSNPDYIYAFIHGTEYPDNSNPAGFAYTTDERVAVGDTAKHHVYFSQNSYKVADCYDDSAAVRAQECYEFAVEAYNNNNLYYSALALGMMTHYISDIASFGHTLGSKTVFGAEQSNHHSSFESSANTYTQKYMDKFSDVERYFGLNDIPKGSTYYREIKPTVNGLLRQQTENLKDGGNIAPYHIAIQLGRISTFLGNETPENFTTTADVYNWYQGVGIIRNDNGYPFYTAPQIKKYYESGWSTSTTMPDGGYNRLVVCNIADNNLDQWVQYEINIAIMGVTYALEQFPNMPDIVSDIDGNEDYTPSNESDDDDGNFFSDFCGAILMSSAVLILLPMIVVDRNGKKKKRK